MNHRKERRAEKIIYRIVAILCCSQWLMSAVLAETHGFHHPELNNAFDNYRLSQVPLRSLQIEHVDSLLQILKTNYTNDFQYEEIGRSVQDRPIYLATLGNGPVKVLLWSQMHGDEPTATAALFDIFNYLLANKDGRFAKTILDSISIIAVPMLNPDGAAKFQRRNAQWIDINRDARDLQSPEGQILFSLKEKYRPDFGFNLHDQSQRRTVGNTNELVAIALMAPPFDEMTIDNPTRIRAKKIVSVIYQSLGPYIYGHIAKYDGDYMPRAFGDSMQNWGVSTILIESGGWYEDRNNFLQKMNFIALLSSLHAIADNSYQNANPAIYEDLMQNDKDLYDLIIRDVSMIDGTGNDAFKADVAINYRPVNQEDAKSIRTGVIAEYGDLDYFRSKETIDGKDLILTPGFIGILSDIPDSEKRLSQKSQKMLQQGYTTLLFPFNAEQLKNLESIKKSIMETQFPGNLGSLLLMDAELESGADSLQLLRHLRKGFTGLAVTDSTLQTAGLSNWVKVPKAYLNLKCSPQAVRKFNGKEIHLHTAYLTEQWSIPRRGKIRPGQIADLVLFSRKGIGRPKVEMILIKGHPIYQTGNDVITQETGECWLPE